MNAALIVKLQNSKWMFPSLMLPLLLGAVLPQIGLVLAIVYAVLNTAGYWVFISGRTQTDRSARWAKGAARFALPLGFVLVLLSEGDSVTDSIDPKDRPAALKVKPHLL